MDSGSEELIVSWRPECGITLEKFLSLFGKPSVASKVTEANYLHVYGPSAPEDEIGPHGNEISLTDERMEWELDRFMASMDAEHDRIIATPFETMRLLEQNLEEFRTRFHSGIRRSAIKNGIVEGKWLIYVPVNSVDRIFATIARGININVNANNLPATSSNAIAVSSGSGSGPTTITTTTTSVLNGNHHPHHHTGPSQANGMRGHANSASKPNGVDNNGASSWNKASSVIVPDVDDALAGKDSPVTGVRAATVSEKGSSYLVAVYVKNAYDAVAVAAVLKALRGRFGIEPHSFKAAIYTHLGIYKENKWGLKPTLYAPKDFD